MLPPSAGCHGRLVFEDVTFRYNLDDSKLLKDVRRYGRMEDVRSARRSRAAAKATPGEPADEPKCPASPGPRSALEHISFEAEPGAAGGAGWAQRRGQDHPHLPDPPSV